jgi:hypothetical protein
LRHPHRHRSFASTIRGQRPALGTVLAWFAVLAMLLAGLPTLHHALPGSAALAFQLPVEERAPAESPQEEAPAKVRRVANTPVATPPRAPYPLAESLDALMATLDTLPPQRVPAIDSAPPIPLPAAPGLRLQRGQAPPQG